MCTGPHNKTAYQDCTRWSYTAFHHLSVFPYQIKGMLQCEVTHQLDKIYLNILRKQFKNSPVS